MRKSHKTKTNNLRQWKLQTQAFLLQGKQKLHSFPFVFVYLRRYMPNMKAVMINKRRLSLLSSLSENRIYCEHVLPRMQILLKGKEFCILGPQLGGTKLREIDVHTFSV